jgi:hypothetical protein
VARNVAELQPIAMQPVGAPISWRRCAGVVLGMSAPTAAYRWQPLAWIYSGHGKRQSDATNAETRKATWHVA